MTPLAALPTVQFVIGLREGVEAALIVGIIATFLYQQGRPDALRWMWTGVAVAVAICVGVAVILQLVDENLPYKQQEGFEAIIGLVAVGMVTAMIFFMRRHAKDLGAELRAGAGAAVARGSAMSLVAMAFLAVMREGLETATFLLATLQSSYGVSPWSAAAGTVAGLLVAAAIGWGIYRGGTRLNLARFFRVTAILLVVIAAGLVSTALGHLNEAGVLTVLQGRALDLSAVITPDSGSILNGLITGLLGIYPYPTVAQVIGWLAYALPMFAVLLWPMPRRPARAGTAAVHGGTAPDGGTRHPASDGEPAVPSPTPSS